MQGKTPGKSASPATAATGRAAAPTGALASAVERAARVAGRRMPSDGVVSDEVGAARAELSRWLVRGREDRGLARDHVARVTRIPMRTVEALEEGRWDELPADVFVRGFLRSYARCVGLPIEEALARYGGCGFAAAPVASAQAQALLDSMSTLAPAAVAARPMTAAPVTSAPRILATAEPARPVEPEVATVEAVLAEAAAEPVVAAPRRKTRRAATVTGGRERDARGRFVRKSVEMAVVIPDEVRAEVEALEAADRAAAERAAEPVASEPPADASIDTMVAVAEAITTPPVATPPVIEVVEAPVVEAPVEAPAVTATTRVVPPRASRSFAAPSLVIDDDHPEDAERTREERARAKDGGWRSFLPPALLDQERGTRQGGLTLAVIILLIVATLTLSYLMRRPSSTGEGITRADVPAERG